MIIKLYLTLAATIGYAVFRYAVVGPVPAANTPVFLINKGVSFTAAALLMYSAWNAYKGKIKNVMWWGKWSWYMAIIHVILSLVIISPEYFGKLYTDKLMNVWGEMTFLAGALCIFVY